MRGVRVGKVLLQLRFLSLTWRRDVEINGVPVRVSYRVCRDMAPKNERVYLRVTTDGKIWYDAGGPRCSEVGHVGDGGTGRDNVCEQGRHW